MLDAENMDRVRAALSFLSPDVRSTWVNQGRAIKDEFGDAGFDLWDDWGSSGNGYTASSSAKTWKSFKKPGVGIGSLFFDAKAAGWTESKKYKKPTAAEIAQRNALRAQRAAAAAAEEVVLAAAAAGRAEALWAAAAPAVEHPYLTRKSVASYGLRVGVWEYTDGETGEVFSKPNCLLIPIIDRQKKLHSLQCIEPSGGPKWYLTDGAKSGHFWPIGKPLQHGGQPVFVLAEGYATAASVHAATGHMVLVCFDAGNLLAVARVLRERAPGAIIIVAADNDIWTTGNPGMAAAGKVAEAVGALVVAPPFTEAEYQTGLDDKGRPVGPTDWNDWHVLHGLEFVAEWFDAALSPPAPVEPVAAPAAIAPPADPEPTLPIDDNVDDEGVDTSGYFTVLGYDRGRYYVLQHEQSQIHVFKGSEIGTDATMLMLAPMNWWEMHFPGAKQGLNRAAFQNWFFRLASSRGIYDIGRLRGRGAWVDDGRIVFHHGLNLSVDGKTVGVTAIKSCYVYELARTLPLPANEALSDADGARLTALAQMFKWSRPGAALLLSGWTFLAPICGALRWRPHIWLTGGAGSGKSTILIEFINGLLGDLSIFAQGASSEAGIRQTLKADALPVLFDESEKNNDGEKRRVDSVLALIRQASTESQAKTLKGSISGDAMNFHIRSMFCLASIQLGTENQADKDRLTPLALLRPDGDSESAAKWEKIKDELYFIGRDKNVSRRMLRRALDLLPVIHKNITVFTEAAAKSMHSQRKGDQYGTLLAGCWCLSSSKVATPAEADAMISAYSWDEFLESSEVEDSEKALRAILEAKLSHKGEVFSVASVVDIAAGGAVDGLSLEGLTALRLLRDNGMNISAGRLLFQNDSNPLKKLVGDTPFAVDLRGQLLRIPGALKMEPRRFASGLSRSVGIPLDRVLADYIDSPI
jgi:putative DNA primase/helicase